MIMEERFNMKPRPAVTMMIFLFLGFAVLHAQDPADLLEQAGISGGIVVEMGCSDASYTRALKVSDAVLVHSLTRDPAIEKRLRNELSSEGRYGPISVDHYDGEHLPYADNLINCIIIPRKCDVSASELLRVTAPLGVLLIKENVNTELIANGNLSGTAVGDGYMKVTKPWPADIDHWPQYLHGADNNAVARDRKAGPPRRLQWTNSPRWSRSHMTIPTIVSMVSSHGRLFSIEDRRTPANPFLPSDFYLIARDAFNGIELWSRPFEDWEPVTRYVKDIAVQLQRRLVADSAVVYYTPGLRAPLTSFRATTGEKVKTYSGTDNTQEFALYDNVLYVITGDRMNSARFNIVKCHKGVCVGGSDPNEPFDGCGFSELYSEEAVDKDNTFCTLLAIDATTGEALWKRESIANYIGGTLAIKGERLVYQTADGLLCLKRTDGSEQWTVHESVTSEDGTSPNTVVITDEFVYAQNGSMLHAHAMSNGESQWSKPISQNYEKSADVFVTGGVVWTNGWTKEEPNMPVSGFDAHTGDLIKTYSQRHTGPMSHDRCYRNFITERYYINSKTGGADFISLGKGHEYPNFWVRGTCGMGVLPCNGLLYSTQYSCQCSRGEMVENFNAFSTVDGLDTMVRQPAIAPSEQLTRGPAFGMDVSGTISDTDWPVYRHDTRRSGSSPCEVPYEVGIQWKAQVSTTPSAPVIAGGQVFVSDIESYSLLALDAQSGRVNWKYVAGGRIDSPPAWVDGKVVFGSSDGCVYCLRASDGELIWKYRGLPERMISAYGRIESAWPVHGSVLTHNGIAYFAAGRSSFLDGGLFIYGLSIENGEKLYYEELHAEYSNRYSAPGKGGRNDILVLEDDILHIGHLAFRTDLSNAKPASHLFPSAGFLNSQPQHRIYWTLGTNKYAWQSTSPPNGDIMVMDESQWFQVDGFPTARHSYFDPRVKGYILSRGRGDGKESIEWSVHVPLTAKAMALVDNAVIVAGEPIYYPPDHPAQSYVDAYEGKLGGTVWFASIDDGRKLGEFTGIAQPVWDGMAVADNRIYISAADGYVYCLSDSPVAIKNRKHVDSQIDKSGRKRMPMVMSRALSIGIKTGLPSSRNQSVEPRNSPNVPDATSRNITALSKATDSPNGLSAHEITIMEHWYGIGGESISDLLESSYYPQAPTVRKACQGFPKRIDVASNYGIRIRGTFVPRKDSWSRFQLAPSFGERILRLKKTSENEYETILHTQSSDSTHSVSAPVRFSRGVVYEYEIIGKTGSNPESVIIRWAHENEEWLELWNDTES